MIHVTRLFDFPYYQLENKPLSHALVTEYNGEWQAMSTQEYSDKSNAVSRAMFCLGIQKDDKIALLSSTNRTVITPL